jgi:hypothetical protein
MPMVKISEGAHLGGLDGLRRNPSRTANRWMVAGLQTVEESPACFARDRERTEEKPMEKEGKRADGGKRCRASGPLLFTILLLFPTVLLFLRCCCLLIMLLSNILSPCVAFF